MIFLAKDRHWKFSKKDLRELYEGKERELLEEDAPAEAAPERED